MCIWAMQKPTSSKGIGYKIVRKTDKEDEFLPYFPFFDKDGAGGIVNVKNYKQLKVRKVRLVYKLGRRYKVRHKYKARPQNYYYKDEKYIAGVHLYTIDPTKGYNLNTQRFRDDIKVGTHSLVKFQYSNATWYDSYDNIIVAMTVTPIEEIKICQ